MQPLVIYHAGCSDGFCAAWLMHQRFPDAECIAANYGESPPDVTGRAVYIVDFSYKRPVMQDIIDRARSVVVLDHHKTAQAELAGIAEEWWTRPHSWDIPPAITFDLAKSGGRLAWEWVYDNQGYADYPLARWVAQKGFTRDTAPWLVDYTEDRDLWSWKLPHSHAINAGLRSYPFDFSRWSQLAESDPCRLASEGTAILRAQQQIVDSHVGFAREVEFAGHRVLAVNATVYTSEIGGELAKGRPFGMTWFRRADGKYIVSLRSRDGGIDVSEIAKQFHGGGHRNAAGCELSHPPC